MHARPNIVSNTSERTCKVPEKPVIHQVRTIAETRLFHIEAVDLEFSNGEQREYERINNSNGGAVMVLPMTEDSLILVREYAVGTEEYELGFVKGLVDPGETPLEASNRELKEEIGMGAGSLLPVRKVRLTPHYTTSVGYTMLAWELYPDPRPGDEPEALEQVHWPLQNLEGLLEHPEINDVRTLHAIYWLRDHLGQLDS